MKILPKIRTLIYHKDDLHSGSACVCARTNWGVHCFVATFLILSLFVSTHPGTAFASERQLYVKGEASALSMPIWVAKELRVFQKYGLNIEKGVWLSGLILKKGCAAL
jgi:hypothetical protein